MPDNNYFSRRSFIQSTVGLAVASPWLAGSQVFAAEEPSGYLKGRLLKTLKIGMVKVEGSLTDKFKAAKAAGFQGIELNLPGTDLDSAKAAIAESGLRVDGSVCSKHWDIRHTSASAEERAEALRILKQALLDTNALGGNTVLLVVGHGKDGAENEIWERSVENISKALPLASELGVRIAVENVWNHFLYDHEGPETQTADKLVRYIDDFNSPWVGMQFDIGNHWKYGSMGGWIRTLGKRIVKLDLKGFSRKEDSFTKIGEGDLDWADVRLALAEIQYAGWAAAEVRGGGPERLQEISANMDRVFGLV